MANLITVKIDVRKLDKARFFEGKADANGHRPLYADLVLVARKEVGKYGDTHLVKQAKKKDDPTELPIIGNATERIYATPAAAPTQTRAPLPAREVEVSDGDVPF
jgi:hypothetical protein